MAHWSWRNNTASLILSVQHVTDFQQWNSRVTANRNALLDELNASLACLNTNQHRDILLAEAAWSSSHTDFDWGIQGGEFTPKSSDPGNVCNRFLSHFVPACLNPTTTVPLSGKKQHNLFEWLWPCYAHFNSPPLCMCQPARCCFY